METTTQGVKKDLKSKLSQINQRVPALLLFGIYNKLVKQLGHDSQS